MDQKVVFLLLEAEEKRSKVGITSSHLHPFSFCLREGWVDVLSTGLNTCSSWGSGVSSEQAGSREPGLSQSELSDSSFFEFLGLPVVISISGYPGSSTESLEGPLLRARPGNQMAQRLGCRMGLSGPISRWNHIQPKGLLLFKQNHGSRRPALPMYVVSLWRQAKGFGVKLGPQLPPLRTGFCEPVAADCILSFLKGSSPWPLRFSSLFQEKILRSFLWGSALWGRETSRLGRSPSVPSSLSPRRAGVLSCFSALTVEAEASLGGVLLSNSFLRRENREFPQAPQSYVGAGKLIGMTLRSFETMSPRPRVSHPPTPGTGQDPEITLVKISSGIENVFSSFVQLLRRLQGRCCQSGCGLLAGKSRRRGVFQLGPRRPWHDP